MMRKGYARALGICVYLFLPAVLFFGRSARADSFYEQQLRNYPNIHGEYDQSRREIQVIKDKLDACQEEIYTLKRRILELSKDIRRQEQKSKEASQKAEEYRLKIPELQEEANWQTREYWKDQENYAGYQREYRLLRSQIERNRKNLARYEEQARNCFQRVEVLESQKEDAEARISVLTGKIVQLKEEYRNKLKPLK